jgi:hypothetical protein
MKVCDNSEYLVFTIGIFQLHFTLREAHLLYGISVPYFKENTDKCNFCYSRSQRMYRNHNDTQQIQQKNQKNSYTDLPFQVFLPRIAKPYILLPFGKMNGQFLHLEAQHSLQTVTFFHQ